MIIPETACVKITKMDIHRVVFMGSPNFAVPALKMLVDSFTVVGVVTQPDREVGRGRKVDQPAIKKAAMALGLDIFQPQTLRDAGVVEKLAKWQPDVIVVAAFGQILRQIILDLPKFGCVNVHASLLPRWRGAAPIQAAILNGDNETGITIMKMDAGLDSGAILAQACEPIKEDDNSLSLSERLSVLGARMLVETLPKYLDGSIEAVIQDERYVTIAKKIEKSDGELNFSEDVLTLERKVRAFYGWPGTFFPFRGEILKVHTSSVLQDSGSIPGKRIVIEKKPAIGAYKGWLILESVQPAGKNRMEGSVFIRGTHSWCDE